MHINMKNKYNTTRKYVLMGMILTMSIFLIGCEKDNKDNEFIELTMDNYAQYLDVKLVQKLSGQHGYITDICLETSDAKNKSSWYKKIEYKASVKGASTNYNYNDVVVSVIASGTYDTYDLEEGQWVRKNNNPIDLKFDVKTNIAGDGSGEEIIISDRWIHETLVNATFEVVAVSGTVTPAK